MSHRSALGPKHCCRTHALSSCKLAVRRLGITMLVIACCLRIAVASEVTFQPAKGQLEISVGGSHFATYVFHDPAIARPYYCNLMTVDGTKVTRNHPLEPTDSQDHTFHSGVFFSFGDLNGIDFWHMQAPCTHLRFEEPPHILDGDLQFVTEEEYRTAEGMSLAQQRVTHRIASTPEGIQISWDLTLTALTTRLDIGSKEEGGLAVRVATPLAVDARRGGQMNDNEGRINGDAIWGQQANWVVYSAPQDGHQVGVQLMSHPGNVRRAYWHARDYGLLVANPFGPLNKPAGGLTILPGESTTFRFGLLVFNTNANVKALAETAFQRYLVPLDTR